jgi:hypothetical protein
MVFCPRLSEWNNKQQHLVLAATRAHLLIMKRDGRLGLRVVISFSVLLGAAMLTGFSNKGEEEAPWTNHTGALCPLYVFS